MQLMPGKTADGLTKCSEQGVLVRVWVQRRSAAAAADAGPGPCDMAVRRSC